MDERGRRKNKNNGHEWDGANAFSNSGFSVWCKLISHSHYEKAFSGSHCLSAASWHSSGSLASSTFVVLLVTVLTKKKQKGEGCFRNVTTKQQQRSRTVWTPLSYPLIIPIWVIPRCAVLSLSISRVWSVGERSTITIVATWKHKDKLEFMHEKLMLPNTHSIDRCVIKETCIVKL